MKLNYTLTYAHIYKNVRVDNIICGFSQNNLKIISIIALGFNLA